MIVNSPENWQVEIRKIGLDQQDAIVIDHFLRDPDEVRKNALALPFEKPPYPYPGLISKPAWDYSMIVESVGKMLGQSFHRDQFSFRFSMVTLAGSELEACQTMPHVDPVTVAGLIYLTPPGHCFGGTAFYRHRATGAEQLPARPDASYLEKMNQAGFSDIREWANFILTPSGENEGFISDSNRDWELLELIPMKYNRLLVYNGKLFHSGYIKDGQFGDNAEQRRLTLNFFISGT